MPSGIIIPNCPSCGAPDAGCAGNPGCPIVLDIGGGAFVTAGFWATIQVEADNLPSADPEGFRANVLAGQVYLDPDTGLPVFDLNLDWRQAAGGSADQATCDILNLEIEQEVATLEGEGYTIVDAGVSCGPSAGPFTNPASSGSGGCAPGQFYSIINERCVEPYTIPLSMLPPPPPGNPPSPNRPPPPPVGSCPPPCDTKFDGVEWQCFCDPPLPSILPNPYPPGAKAPAVRRGLSTGARPQYGLAAVNAAIAYREQSQISSSRAEYSATFKALNPTLKPGLPKVFKYCGCNDPVEEHEEEIIG